MFETAISFFFFFKCCFVVLEPVFGAEKLHPNKAFIQEIDLYLGTLETTT